MKKLTLALVAAMSLSTAAFAADAVQGSEGQIKFIGEVTEAGCIIDSGANSTIQLGSMPKGALNNKGFSSWAQGQLKFLECNLQGDGSYLTTGKGYVSSVELTILPGTAYSSAQGTLNNKVWRSTGYAENVGVEVMIAGEEPAQPIPPTGVTTPIIAQIDPTNHTAIYVVEGRMVAPEKDATAGSVEATVTFRATYK